MTAPALAAQRFALALLLGAQLGVYYSFLRPLRPRHTSLSDLLFLPVAFWGYLYHGFAICNGDLRPGYSAGLVLGGILWELTLGRLLRPVCTGFWRFCRRLGRIFLSPVRIFFKKTAKSIKFLLATAKKAVTIKCKTRLRERKPK